MSPYSVPVHPGDAQQLLRDSATLLLLDAPQDLVFGIDLMRFSVGPKFCGMKMIPPGPHLITTTLASTEKCVPTVVEWRCTTCRECYIARWNEDCCRFELLTDEDEAMRYRAGVNRFDFDGGLAPYPLHLLDQWRQLSAFIDFKSVRRLQPVCGFIDTLEESQDLLLLRPSSAAEQRLMKQLCEGSERFGWRAPEAKLSNAGHTGICRYTRVPVMIKGQAIPSSPDALTSANMDKSGMLGNLFGNDPARASQCVLEELQFSFVNFLCGSSMEGFLQWKALVVFLLSCDEAALKTHTPLFVKVLQVISAQLSLALDFTADGQDNVGTWAGAFGDHPVELLDDSFIKSSLQGFLASLSAENDVPARLWSQAQLLAEMLKEKLGWDIFEEEDGPIVVET